MQYEQGESNQDQIHESKGLFIPIEILNDKNLSHGEKILLSQIYWYDQFTECHASNKHLANLMNMNIRGLQKMIKKLKDKKYLNSNGLCNRILRLNHVQMDTPCPEGHVQMDTPPCPNGHGNHVQMDTPIKKNIKKIIKKNIYVEKANKILSEINRIGKEKGIIKRELTQTTQIIARLKDKFSEEDILSAIFNCWEKEWFIISGKATDLEYILRKSKITGHINMGKGIKPKPKSQPKPASIGLTVAEQWETRKKHSEKIDEYRKELVDSGKHSDSSIQHMVDNYIQDLYVKEMD